MPDREHIPIEDFHEDIIGKVIRGKNLQIPALAQAAGLSVDQIEALLDGEVDEAAIRALAPQLGLDANALVISANKIWRPRPVDLTVGLAVFNSEWGDMRVNAFVVWDPASRKAAIFDTGADATEMIRFIEKHQLIVNSIYLTHTHGDHVAELPRLIKHFPGATTYIHRLERLRGIESEDVGRAFDAGIEAVVHRHERLPGTSFLSVPPACRLDPLAISVARSLRGVRVSAHPSHLNPGGLPGVRCPPRGFPGDSWRATPDLALEQSVILEDRRVAAIPPRSPIASPESLRWPSPPDLVPGRA